jgi:hypothetical protein
MGRLSAVVAAVLTISACTTPLPTVPSTTPQDTWALLAARPLKLPAYTRGSPCPTSSIAELGSATAAVAGPGPVFSAGNVIGGYGTAEPDLRRPAKVLWVASPAYVGPALIRGRRLDDSTDVRFERSTPSTDLRFPLDTGIRAGGSDQGWRYLPSTVLVPGMGCYAFQIDAPDWTIIVVMRGDAT